MNLMVHSNQAINRAIDFCRNGLAADRFLSLEKSSIKIAEYSAPLGAAIGLGICIVGAIKLDSFLVFVSGIVWVIAVAVSYYVGSRFSERCKRVIENSASTLSSAEFLDVFALLFVASALLMFSAGLYWAIEASSFDPMKWAIPMALVFLMFAALLLNPSLISTQLKEDATGGQDALAISLVLYKAVVRQADIVFGIGSLIGSSLLFKSLYSIFRENGEYILLGGLQSIAGVFVLIMALTFPFAIYVVFVFVYLLVDICRAILTLNDRRG